jgi:hypothetical protein
VIVDAELWTRGGGLAAVIFSKRCNMKYKENDLVNCLACGGCGGENLSSVTKRKMLSGTGLVVFYVHFHYIEGVGRTKERSKGLTEYLVHI